MTLTVNARIDGNEICQRFTRHERGYVEASLHRIVSVRSAHKTADHGWVTLTSDTGQEVILHTTRTVAEAVAAAWQAATLMDRAKEAAE